MTNDGRRKDIRSAAVALSDLNVFAIVEKIVEGGSLHSPSHRGAEKIIRICRDEMQKRLRDYDRAVAKASDGGDR
jgi:hypothetical protein